MNVVAAANCVSRFHWMLGCKFVSRMHGREMPHSPLGMCNMHGYGLEAAFGTTSTPLLGTCHTPLPPDQNLVSTVVLTGNRLAIICRP